MAPSHKSAGQARPRCTVDNIQGSLVLPEFYGGWRAVGD